MDCRTARLLLDYARPSETELDAGEATALHGHLDGCPECAALGHTERRLEEHLGAAVRAVPVPEGLRDRLLARLQKDRREWYQRWWLRRAVGAAAAAVILLTGWLVFARSQRPPVPNVEDIESLLVAATPDSIEEWFRDTYKVHTVVPPQFNYALLTHYDLANFPVQVAEPIPFLRPAHRRVPFLFFIKTDLAADGGPRVHSARVYILSDKEFDLKRITEGHLPGSGGNKIEVRRHPDNRHIVYVIVYTSNTLDPFLVDQPRPAA